MRGSTLFGYCMVGNSDQRYPASHLTLRLAHDAACERSYASRITVASASGGTSLSDQETFESVRAACHGAVMNLRFRRLSHIC